MGQHIATETLTVRADGTKKQSAHDEVVRRGSEENPLANLLKPLTVCTDGTVRAVAPVPCAMVLKRRLTDAFSPLEDNFYQVDVSWQ